MPTKSHGLDDCVVIFTPYLTDVAIPKIIQLGSTSGGPLPLVDKQLSNSVVVTRVVTSRVVGCHFQTHAFKLTVTVEREDSDISRPELQLEHLFNVEHFHLPRIMLKPWFIWSAIFNTARYLLSSTEESFCKLI